MVIPRKAKDTQICLMIHRKTKDDNGLAATQGMPRDTQRNRRYVEIQRQAEDTEAAHSSAVWRQLSHHHPGQPKPDLQMAASKICIQKLCHADSQLQLILANGEILQGKLCDTAKPFLASACS